MGIYKIINTVNGKYYVGSSNHVHRRKRRHHGDLRLGLHYNEHLQRAWNKYGESNFDFVLVESITNENRLLDVEQQYLDVASQEKNKCYNTSFSAERTWLSEETKQKIRESMIGVPKSQSMRQKCRLNMIGTRNHRYGKPQAKTIYRFQHKITLEIFVGTQYDLTMKCGFPNGSMNKLASGKRKSLWGWKLLA